MPLPRFCRFFRTESWRRRTKSTFVLLTIAAIGYAAGSLVHEPLSRIKEAFVFVRPVGAAEGGSANAISPEAEFTPMPGTYRSRLHDADAPADPRECDLPNGISTACIFMD